MANDVLIAGVIVLILASLGVFMPMLNDDFGSSYSSFGVERSIGNITSSELPNSILSVPSGLNALRSVLFWTPDIPDWLNVFLWVFRAMLYFIIFRNLWIGGGG